VALASRLDLAFQQCIDPACAASFGVDEVLTACPVCKNLLDIEYEWDRLEPPASLRFFETKWTQRSAACGGFTNCCLTLRVKAS